jgi:hypothetical protein
MPRRLVPHAQLSHVRAGVLHHAWAPSAYIVSFKLETDASLLHGKAQKAMQRYGVHAVVRATRMECLRAM